MNPTVAKHVVKFGFGAVISAIIGVIIKYEHKVDDRIDAHYESKKKQEDPESEEQD